MALFLLAILVAPLPLMLVMAGKGLLAEPHATPMPHRVRVRVRRPRA